MAIGIGTDIIKISRITDTISRSGDRLAVRVLTHDELKIYREHAQPAAYLAKRFAAKEAAVKALGTGIGKVSWQDLQTTNDELGAPLLSATGAAANIMQEKGATRLHLSLSDEEDFALAFVILE